MLSLGYHSEMRFPLLGLIFILTPLFEIYLFIVVGGGIGAFATIVLIVTTAVIGITMLRAQGFSVMRRFQLSVARGELPAMELAEGALLLVGGALLLTPGFFTDAIGFLCLLPTTRRFLIFTCLPRLVPRRPATRRRIIEGEQVRSDRDWDD